MNFLCWQNVRREREMSVTINYNCQGGKFREYDPKPCVTNGTTFNSYVDCIETLKSHHT